jgi:hypothetical protein
VSTPPDRIANIADELHTDIAELRQEFKELKQKVGLVGESAHIPEERLTELAQDFFKKSSFQKMEQDIQERYGTNIDNTVKVKHLRDVASKSIEALAEQISKQRNNANINMLIGGILATLGIIVMGAIIYLYYTQKGESDLLSFFTLFIPWLSFVILIETVAFFFLTLYKEDRNMIRYFRNEITNLDAKYLALEAALRFDDKTSLSNILAVLAGTERNFTIKKGEKMVVEALREADERLFDKTVDKLANMFENITKVRGKSS